ncbi:MAG: NACHT domain-containing protein, partial [Nitrososphaeraceae archaeon]|nr:NACHT domain-containing protein [Nitrososphaeraceae archaeon]
NDTHGRSLNFNSFGQVVVEKGILGIEVVKRNEKLMIWGMAGAGKTTFLKYLAMHFPPDFFVGNQANIAEQPLPFFISLKKFAESKNRPSLTDKLIEEFNNGIKSSTDTTDLSLIQDQLERFIKEKLERGECLILLDGLDEVLGKENLYHVHISIDTFNKKYPSNRVVITCRCGASEYVFKDFVEVEIADFNDEEIKNFIRKWFKNSKDIDRVEQFLIKLETNQSIKELAKNPLLLTLLCLTIGESYDLPKNRNSLYDDAVDVLLRKWDATRNIERENIYEDKLSRQRKLNMLSEIAYNAFIQKPQKYFWHKWELEAEIRKFIENIDVVESESLDVDSQQVLKAIESHHGILTQQARWIYSFSHLTFQEYFTSRYILESREPSLLDNIINKHLTDYQWREVFLTIAERLPNANDFLKAIFSYANELVVSNELQEMLKWLDSVTTSFEVSSSSWRAMYLTIDLDTDLYIDNNIDVDRNIAQTLSEKLREINKKRDRILPPQPKCFIAVNLSVIHSFAVDKAYNRDWKIQGTSEFIKERLGIVPGNLEIQSKFNETVDLASNNDYVDLANALSNLKRSYPSDDNSALKWQDWADNLQEILIQHLNVGYDVSFSEKDAKALNDYLYINNLLLDCTLADIYALKDLRDQLIDHLLLPKERIPQYLLVSSTLSTQTGTHQSQG